jgi:outer membrane protein assembly factor BamA
VSLWGQDVERFEERYISLAYAKHNLEPEPHPQGKEITQIIIERGEAIDEYDLYPQFMNIFHPMTKEYVIRQELLFEVGDLYDEEIIKESGRNLRALFIFNVAVISSFKRKDGVGILVITKDLWTLKPENDFTLLGNDIEYLYLAIVDRNIAGRNKTARVSYRLDKGTYQFGEFFEDPRILGSRWSLSQNFNISFNRDTSEREGENGSVLLHRPLYSLSTKWSYYGSFGFDRGISREFKGMDVIVIEDSVSGELHPWEYTRKNMWGSLGFTRSYGRSVKHNLSLNYSLSREKYRTTGSFASESFERWFEQNYLPMSEKVGSIGAGYVTWRPDFKKLYNVNSLGLVEDFRFGHFFSLSLSWANHVFGGTTDFVGVDLAATYQWLLFNDDIFSMNLSHNRRIRKDDTVNLFYSAGFRNITPSFWLGRLHTRGALHLIRDNIDNSTLKLGGNSGLRGFESEIERGVSRITFNVEYRTRPVEFKTIYIGAAAFWDRGEMFDEDFSDIGMFHSIGAGLRLLFPQGDMQAIRLDFAKPLNGPDAGISAYISFAVGQAF